MASPAIVEGVSGALGGIAALLATYVRPHWLAGHFCTCRGGQLSSVGSLPGCAVRAGWAGWQLQCRPALTGRARAQPLMTISTLQSTRRSRGSKQGDEEDLVVPVQRRKGTFADIAEVTPHILPGMARHPVT